MWPFKKKDVSMFEKGLLPSPPDNRDYALSSVAPIIQRYPDVFPMMFDTTISHQGSVPSCFPSGTPILTEDFSYKPIQDLRIGDYVFTHKGNIKKVSEIFKRKWQGTMKSFKVWGDYREIIATQEHPILAIKKPNSKRKKYIGNRKMAWVKTEELIRNEPIDFYPLKELSKGDWVAIPFNNIIKDKTIYSFEKDPDFLWILGLYLAEGCIKKHEVSFSLHKKEFDWYEKIKSIMNKYGANTTYSFKEENGLTIRISGKKWANIFQELGNKLCENKEINKRLMFLEPYLQMKIVEGFSDGDGHIRRKQHHILVSTSEKLLIQIRIILLKNKIYSSLQKRKERDDRKPVWVLEYYQQSKYGFIKDDYYFARIKETKNIPAFMGGYVYNIEVEDDNSYIVNSIAVHNCVGHTAAGMKQYLELREKVSKDFDGDWIYNECKKIDGIPNTRGTYLRTGLEILRKVGAKPTDETDPTPYKIEMYVRNDENTFEGIKKAIFLYGTVMAGFTGSNEGWRGEVVRPPKSGESIWGHAVRLVAYEKNYLIGANSWGESAHNKGFFKVPKTYLPFESWVVVLDKPTTLSPEPIKTGWLAVNWIIESGGVWKTTANLNVRKDAGLNYSIIKTLPKGTILNLTNSPRRSADGYTWAETIL